MSDGRPVVVMGRLIEEPKLRRGGPGGAAFLKLKLAVMRNGKQEPASARSVIDVSVRGRLAEICAGSLKKGGFLEVGGSLKVHRSKAADGKGRTRLEVIADRVQVVKPTQRTRDSRGS